MGTEGYKSYKQHFRTIKPKRLTEEEYNKICDDFPIYLNINGMVE